MEENQPQSNPLQEQLRLMQQCPVCQAKFTPDLAKVLAKRGEVQLIHITCQRCHNALLAVIVVSALGMSSVGMVTDLNATDVKRLEKKSAITEDELLNFHALLKERSLLG